MRRFLISVLLAMGLVAPSLVASADVFEGVSWAVPPGLELDDQWDMDCPGKCLTYEGAEPHFDDKWPIVIVHEPALDGVDGFVRRWTAAQEAANDEPVTELGREVRPSSDGVTLTAIMALTEADDGYGRSGPDASFLLIYEMGGVVLPTEIHAFGLELLSERSDALSMLVGSVQMDADAVKRRVGAGQAEQAARTLAVSDAYASGQGVELFVSKDMTIQPTYGLSGMEMRHRLNVTTYALLPGGVLLTQMPQDLRAPDLAQLRVDDAVGGWQKSGAAYALTMPDGSAETARLDRNGDLVVAGETIPRVHVPSRAELVGRYASADVSGTGAPMPGSGVTVAGQVWKGVELKRDGRFTKSVDSSTIVSAPGVVGSAGRDGIIEGSWSYDASSYMLSLLPDGGGAVMSGPSFCYGCDGGDYRGGNWDWMMLGDPEWWVDNDG